MERKVILTAFLALSLAMIIAVAALAPTAAVGRHQSDDNSLTYYSNGGQVTVQLPEGVPSHPTTLLFAAFHVERRGDYPINGPHDVLAVYLWVPALNSFLPVVTFSDNPNPAHHDLMKEVFYGTPIWTLGLMENYYIPDDEDLVTWKRWNIFFANLTEGVHVSLPFDMLPDEAPLKFLGDLSFDLPPIALEIRAFDSPYSEEGGSLLPSGWSMSSTYLRKPAWVRVWIQGWTGGGDAFKFAGVRALYSKVDVTPPAA